MDPLEFSYDSMDTIPEAFRSLYSEKDGKAVLTGINGVKSISDVNNLSEALRKERNDHKLAQEQLKSWSTFGKKPEEIQSQLDRIAELEAAGAGKIDEKKISELVEARLGQKTGPLERQLKELSTNYESVTKERDDLRSQINRRDMSDAVRVVANEMKVLPTAIADVELFAQMVLERQEDGSYITKSGVPGVTPGVDVKSFLKDMQKHRPHWWPPSQGGGAGGANGNGFGGVNPWSSEGWNLTEQSKIVREQGLATAEKLAKAANSYVGATRATAKK